MCFQYSGYKTTGPLVLDTMPPVINDLVASGFLSGMYTMACKVYQPVATIWLDRDERWHVTDRVWGLLPHRWTPTSTYNLNPV